MVNSEAIKKRMDTLDVGQADGAEALGIKQSTFCLKINNKRGLTLDEANALASFLKITNDEFPHYFFYSESCETQQTAS
ncbi:MAG: helix-turn-helix transcriptional regulator [Clostridia bacterium]|nr:helix-turn-helix transcriptional regulator [Clostridia bacterium]